MSSGSPFNLPRIDPQVIRDELRARVFKDAVGFAERTLISEQIQVIARREDLRFFSLLIVDFLANICVYPQVLGLGRRNFAEHGYLEVDARIGRIAVRCAWFPEDERIIQLASNLHPGIRK